MLYEVQRVLMRKGQLQSERNSLKLTFVLSLT
jgi:hypothetical protein